eukprot:CAMPEP_0174719302 /NCGR_PEP_ID=MMETSP1094-20130205/30898_1 /TAXON_ID=156173 /ORGANISM="Chrysochromulina brevifilum, Strain UTEX LB 985" /LENGTH=352 /DNA_ID=CAMNT_0015919579 /DNA_START=215 /DNA_END=1270 /DNA_ORIENTATION=+
MSLSTMRRINIGHALLTPTPEALCELLSELCSTGLWKFGSCFEDLLDIRPFDSAHYNPTYYNTAGAICVAFGITGKALAATLETAAIKHLKHTLRVGVNDKSSDDVPHDRISATRLQALYIVPVLPRFTTQQQFWDEHKSYYKQTNGGAGLMEQRRALGLSAHTPSTEDGRKHDGGKQPKKHVCMNDDDFVSGLIHSGIPLAQLDSAFAGQSCGRLNKLLAVFWKVPEVARKLALLFGGKEIRDSKFKRVKPIFERARSSGETTEEDDDLAPALRGEYEGLVDVLPDGTAVLEFNTPLSLLLSSGASSSSAPLPLDDASSEASLKSTSLTTWQRLRTPTARPEHINAAEPRL